LVEPEHQVVHLKDRFAANTPDETWMAALAGEPDWIIVSGDLQIRKNPHEIHAWKAAGHTTFFLKAGWINLPSWTQTWKFVKCFPDIVALAARAKKGTFFMVSTMGKIEK
jgi:PIN like domain